METVFIGTHEAVGEDEFLDDDVDIQELPNVDVFENPWLSDEYSESGMSYICMSVFSHFRCHSEE